jgi:hypothetical protein
VAKFRLTALDPLWTVPTTTLTLTGFTADGLAFAGDDVVRVIE